MPTPLRRIAQLVDGKLCGDGDVPISGASTVSTVRSGEITLAENNKFLQQLAGAPAVAVVVPHGLSCEHLPFISVEDVHAAFAQIVSHFRPPRLQTRIGISPEARVSPSAQIAPDVDIHPGTTVGNEVRIGKGCVIHSGGRVMAGCSLSENVTLFPNVVLYENTSVGARTIIHAGAVIGAFGFGYEIVDGHHQISPQLGYVDIGADVEIGACTTIDRGTYGATTIGEGTKIDNQVMVAHNCRIGRHNMICSQVGIAGSTTTGDYVVMAGQVGVRDHVHIGHRATLGAKSGIMADIPDDGAFVGIPATPEREQMYTLAALARLPEMRKQLKKLQREIRKLSDGHDESSGKEAA